MYARELVIRKIKKTLRPESITSVQDFVLKEKSLVDFKSLWETQAHTLSPYCIDNDRGELLFALIPAEVDLTAVSPFYYQAQRESAVKLYAVAYEDLHRLAESVPDRTSQCIFLHSTGRCGSTLLCRLMGAAGTVQSLSEPDVYTQIAMLDSEARTRQRESLEAVVASYTRVLAHHCHVKKRESPYLVIKLRSQGIYIGDWIRHATPAAKHIFLYRNGLPVVSSYVSAFDSKLARAVDRLKLWPWLMRVGKVRETVQAMVPITRHPPFAQLDYKSSVGIATMLWLSVVDRALHLQTETPTFFSGVVRYEELLTRRHQLVMQLLRNCEVAVDDSLDTDSVFARNSQKGSRLESRGSHRLSPRDVERVRKMIALHETIQHPEFVVPGTLC